MTAGVGDEVDVGRPAGTLAAPPAGPEFAGVYTLSISKVNA
jgi:hypothetical protein